MFLVYEVLNVLYGGCKGSSGFKMWALNIVVVCVHILRTHKKHAFQNLDMANIWEMPENNSSSEWPPIQQSHVPFATLTNQTYRNTYYYLAHNTTYMPLESKDITKQFGN